MPTLAGCSGSDVPGDSHQFEDIPLSPLAARSQKWLVVRLSALGDVVLTSGVLSYLHERYGWSFVVLTLEQWAPVFDRHPAVESVHGVQKAACKGNRLHVLAQELRERYSGYGLLDLHGTLRSKIIALRWKGPVLRYPKFAIERRLFLRSNRRWFRKKLLAANVPQRYALAVTAAAPPRELLIPRIYMTPDELARGRELLGATPATDGGAAKQTGATSHTLCKCVALHPFSTHPNKAWHAEAWQTLADMLLAAGYDVVCIGIGASPFSGSSSDGPFNGLPGELPGELLNELPGELSGESAVERGVFLDLANITTLRETCAVLAACDTLVTGDSGPMHLACGVQTPVIALFGPTHRVWGFYPEGPHDVVLEAECDCRPCSLHGTAACRYDQRCMKSLLPADVFVRLEHQLATIEAERAD